MIIEGAAFGLLISEFSADVVTTRLPRITGFSGGVAEIGTLLTATLGGQTASGAIQWFADGVAIAGATAASFTPSAAQEATALSVTVDDVASASVAVHYPQPLGTGAIADQDLMQGTGLVTLATASAFTFAGVLDYQLMGAPIGVTAASASGVITFDTDTLDVQTATSVALRASDSTNASRFAEQSFLLSVEAEVSSSFDAPAILSVTFSSVTLDAMGVAPPQPAAPSILSTQTGAVTLAAA